MQTSIVTNPVTPVTPVAIGNVPITGATTPVTPIAEKNDDVKRVTKKFKTRIDFELNENLVYYLNDGKRRLCFFSSIKKTFFHLAHDENMHAGIHHCINRLIDIFYKPRFFKKIRFHIENCFNCQFTQTKKHRFYGKLMFIIFLFISTVPYYNH